MSPERLATKVIAWQLGFSVITSLALYGLMPSLLLAESEQKDAALALTLAVLLSGSISIAHGWGLVWARRRLLSHLTERENYHLHHIDLPKLNDDPWQIVNVWFYSGVALVTLAMTVTRPAVIPAGDAFTLAVFASIVLAAASLPLFLMVRRDFVALMERVPPGVMADVIDAQVRSRRLRGKTSRRLLAAMATPVAFLALGSALISGAHVRSLEKKLRKKTALTALYSALPTKEGSNRGVRKALSALSQAGYRVTLHEAQRTDIETKDSHGIVDLLVPWGTKSARVAFVGTTVWALSWRTVPIAVVALLCSLWVSVALARLLSGDLRMATHGVRMLGTDAALEGTRVMKPARFVSVAELGTAIEALAYRFRLFARAQEDSIQAKSAATKARGRFFASVSHDLKSPLNAILGFAELSRRDPLTNQAQRESIDMIIRRGSELLSLIETILDAARVEAGQLQLEFSDEQVDSLLESALDRASTLTAETDVFVRLDVPDGLPPLSVDRLRFSSALATFIAHARRTAERGSMRILVECEPLSDKPTLKKRKLVLFIEIPSTRFSAIDLQGMLHPEKHPGQHRGLSLALRLAKSVIELHGGQVTVPGRTVSEPAFAIHLRGPPGR